MEFIGKYLTDNILLNLIPYLDFDNYNLMTFFLSLSYAKLM